MLLRDKDGANAWNSALMGWQKIESGDREKQLQESCSLSSFFNGKGNFMVINIYVM